VSEAELEAIARGGAGAAADADLADGAGGEATRRLLGDYQTPARRAPARSAAAVPPPASAPAPCERARVQQSEAAVPARLCLMLSCVGPAFAAPAWGAP
jgi:pre-mRNA-splicing factor CDC5/CEF1